MRISVVLPSLNQAPYLPAALASVLDQRHPELELLVRDGGSNDGSVAILQRWKQERGGFTWQSGPDGGQAAAINAGLRGASGDVLAFLNSDDTYTPDAFARVEAYFAAHPDCLVLYGNGEQIDAAGRSLGPYPTEDWDYERLHTVCFICQPAVFWRREVVERWGVLDASLHYALDYEYWLRLGRSIAFQRLPGAPLACTRIHAATKTESAKVAVHRECLEVVLRHGGSGPAVVKWLRALADCELAARPRLPGWWRARAALHAGILWAHARRYGIAWGPELRHEFRRALGGRARWESFGAGQ